MPLTLVPAPLSGLKVKDPRVVMCEKKWCMSVHTKLWDEAHPCDVRGGGRKQTDGFGTR